LDESGNPDEADQDYEEVEYPEAGPSRRDPTPDPPSEDESPEPETQSLTDVLALLAKVIKDSKSASVTATPSASSALRKKTPKVKEPDTFDGSDPHKLYAFIVQCSLYFTANSDLYNNNDTNMVTFALSYLRGTAAQWFEPQLLGAVIKRPSWIGDWALFETELRDNFGPVDPVADAEAELDNLVMRDHHKLMKYNVAFNRLAARVQWGDAALVHRYYKGLCNHIKDSMMDGPKPSTLVAMRTRAQAIDARHWERESEKSRAQGKSSDPKRTPATPPLLSKTIPETSVEILPPAKTPVPPNTSPSRTNRTNITPRPIPILDPPSLRPLTSRPSLPRTASSQLRKGLVAWTTNFACSVAMQAINAMIAISARLRKRKLKPVPLS
jgi:hypothetical protein